MISNSTLDKIVELSQAIGAAGKVATPAANTPLALLCSNSTVTGFSTGENVVTKIATESDNVIHNSIMDETISNVATAVCGHIDFAKNVVNPAIKEVVEYLNKNLDGYTNESVIDTSIKRISVPDFLKNTSIKGDLEGYSAGGTRRYIEPEGPLNLPNIENDLLPEGLSTGSGNLDVSIGSWVMGLKAGFLKEVWENFFCDPKEHRRGAVDMLSFLADPEEGDNRAIAIYLFARRISTAGPRQRNIEFGSRLKQFLEVSAYKVSAFIKNMETAEASQQVILGYDKIKRVIRVCSPVYLPWLEKGNTPEIVYGAVIVGGNIYTATKLAERREELLKAWSVHRAALNSSYRNSYYNSYIKGLRDGFFNSMASMMQAEREYHDANPTAANQVAKILEDELKNITVEDRKDHYRTATRIVTKARYFYTDSFTFLNAVDALTKDNTMSLEEALHIATIEYVSDYVSGQILIR